MDAFDLDLALPILGAALAGGLIGAEREYRASPAGFRTHALVSLSSALLMLAAVHQVQWLSDTPHAIVRIDPVRMAHGVLTGIGFLCGGVIFREGFNVRGLTTAASLWMTASLGILFGVGFYKLAIGGAVATLVILAAVSASERLLPQRRYAQIKLRYRRADSFSLDEVRGRLGRVGLRVTSVTQHMDGDLLEYGLTVIGDSEERMAAFTAIVRDNPNVTGFDYVPHDT